MKKFLALLLALVTVLCCFVACNKDSDGENDKREKTKEETEDEEAEEETEDEAKGKTEYEAEDEAEEKETEKSNYEYSEALDNYFDYYFKTDIRKLESLAPQEYWDFCDETGLFNIDNSSEVKKCHKYLLADQEEYLEEKYGNNIEYSYKVISETTLSAKKRVNIADDLRDDFDIPLKAVTEAKELDLEFKISGNTAYEEQKFEGIIVVKISGNWYYYDSNGFGDYTDNYDWEAYNEYIAEKEAPAKDEAVADLS